MTYLYDALNSLFCEIEAASGNDHFWYSNNAKDLQNAMREAELALKKYHEELLK